MHIVEVSDMEVRFRAGRLWLLDHLFLLHLEWEHILLQEVLGRGLRLVWLIFVLQDWKADFSIQRVFRVVNLDLILLTLIWYLDIEVIIQLL